MKYTAPPGTFLFTSESVGEGHPDKICDQIADAMLDFCLKDNPLSKVAKEAAVRPGLVCVFGVVESVAVFDVDAIVRMVLKDIGHDTPEQELDYQTCQVINHVERRVPSSAHSVDLEPAEGENAGTGYKIQLCFR